MRIYGEFPRRNQLRGWTDPSRTGRIHFRVVPWVSGQVSGASRRDILFYLFVSLIFLILLLSLWSISQLFIFLTLVWLSHLSGNISQDLDYTLSIKNLFRHSSSDKRQRDQYLLLFCNCNKLNRIFILQNHINRQDGAERRRGCWAQQRWFMLGHCSCMKQQYVAAYRLLTDLSVAIG